MMKYSVRRLFVCSLLIAMIIPALLTTLPGNQAAGQTRGGSSGGGGTHSGGGHSGGGGNPNPPFVSKTTQLLYDKSCTNSTSTSVSMNPTATNTVAGGACYPASASTPVPEFTNAILVSLTALLAAVYLLRRKPFRTTK